MKITIEATEKLTKIDGVLCRVWKGVSEHGANCVVFVRLIAVPTGELNEEFERELAEQLPPGRVFELRHIL